MDPLLRAGGAVPLPITLFVLLGIGGSGAVSPRTTTGSIRCRRQAGTLFANQLRREEFLERSFSTPTTRATTASPTRHFLYFHEQRFQRRYADRHDPHESLYGCPCRRSCDGECVVEGEDST